MSYLGLIMNRNVRPDMIDTQITENLNLVREIVRKMAKLRME